MSNQYYQKNSVKRRLEEIDNTLDSLTRSLQDLNDFGVKAEFEHKITAIRLKREKTQALAAVAKSQKILAEMEILIAQNDINGELEKLKCYKKIKLDDIRANLCDGNYHVPLLAQADKSSQTKKVSSKIKPKKQDDNKKKTITQKSSNDSNHTPEHASPAPNSTELKSKHFENRTSPNSNTSFEIKNKTSKVSNSNKKADNLFKIPIIGQKTTNRAENRPENVSRQNLPAIQSRHDHRAATSFSNRTPYKLIYSDDLVTSGCDLFNERPEAYANDNKQIEMLNVFFRDLMESKWPSLNNTELDTSACSSTTVKLEELLSS